MIKVKWLTPGVLLNQVGYVQYLKFKKNQLRSFFVLDLSIHAKKGPKYFVRHFVNHLGTLKKISCVIYYPGDQVNG